VKRCAASSNCGCADPDREPLLLREEKGFHTLFFEGQEAADGALFAGYDGMICGMGALCSKIMKKLASCMDKGDVKGATVAQNKMIRVFHGVYGIELSNIWNGQKYALQQLGLIATPFTIAQEMDSLTDAVTDVPDNEYLSKLEETITEKDSTIAELQLKIKMLETRCKSLEETMDRIRSMVDRTKNDTR